VSASPRGASGDPLFTVRSVLFVLGGAAAGFAYHRTIGCATGTCPLTSNPWIATAYGAVLGLSLSAPS
jgi:hypothetical protein